MTESDAGDVVRLVMKSGHIVLAALAFVGPPMVNPSITAWRWAWEAKIGRRKNKPLMTVRITVLNHSPMLAGRLLKGAR